MNHEMVMTMENETENGIYCKGAKTKDREREEELRHKGENSRIHNIA